MGRDWVYGRPKELKKPVYAMNAVNLQKLIAKNEERGWKLASEIKKHGYGLGCMMVWDRQ
jgi:hypothetical protein